MFIIKCITNTFNDFPNFGCFVSQIPSQPIVDNSQPTQSPPVSRPSKRIASNTAVVCISNICYYSIIYFCYF
jgi:hypothetical protein